MMSSPMIKWGIYYGVANILFAIVSYFVNTEWLFGGTVATVFSFGSAILFLVLAMKETRTINEGYLSFGEALKVGVVTFAIGTFLSTLFSWALFNFIDPSLIDASIAYQMETVKSMTETMGNMVGMSEEVMEEALAKAEADMADMGNPASLSILFGGWLMALLFGLILSLIIGAIMKKS